MKDVRDQAVLITGSTSGLGRATASVLAERGAAILMHGRNREKLERIARELERESGNERIRTYLADLASLDQVRRLATEVERTNERLDLLINNAAMGFGAPNAGRETSEDGYELRLAVNYLAPYLLTLLLLPILRRSAPSRIVNVASLGQEDIDFSDVMLERDYNGPRAYRQSKTALVMFTFDLADRLKGEAITVNSLHPATYMDTAMVRESRVPPRSSVRSGVEALMYVATSPELDGASGKFFDRMTAGRAISQAYDAEARMNLRRLSEELTGAKLPDVPRSTGP
jgi:NAD(P)-dependent dehydrogenase (short-subunit alcohol dehydrogenase family)